MMSATWLVGLIRHRGGRLFASALGVALAVGLLASIGTFLSASKSVMTERAASSVAVDWQIETQPSARSSILQRVRSAPQLRNVTEVGFGEMTGLVLQTGDTTQSTGPGVVLGLPAEYRVRFPNVIRVLVGQPSGVLLAQQTAANLHATVGDTVAFARKGLSDVKVRVVGIVDLPSADSLFQKVGAPSNSQPKAPPDNVLILPFLQWNKAFSPLRADHPELVKTQVHASIAGPLPADPSAAYNRVIGAANNLELALSGDGLVGNNLGAELEGARKDSLYAQILFLFLGLPGAALAGLLTATIASSGAPRRRRDQALLRTRGASLAQLVRLAAAEAVLVGTVGGIIGIAMTLIVSALAFHSSSFGASSLAGAVWLAASCAVGMLVALLAIVVPAWRDAKLITVNSARRVVGRTTDPRWMRWGLDVILIGASLLAFWSTSRNGYKLVLAVEGVPTISVNYWAFVGPALAWIGGGMFVWRIATTLLRRGRRLSGAVLRPFSGGLSDTVAASMSRQRTLLARGLTLVALSVVFAGSTSIFNATYQAQAEVDAVLSNGAMVTVLHSPGQEVSPSQSNELAKVKGVRSVTSLQHRYAYVGSDLQDMYGIDASTIVKATKLQDAYFAGGTAKVLMAKLARTPNAALVSAETVKDFQLTPGDTINLRLQDGKTKQYRPVTFTYVGVVLEFPTAPSDSFILANAAYIAKQTGTDTVGTFLVDTARSDSGAVTKRLQNMVGTSGIVRDITGVRRQVGSSLTSVELSGLTKVELGYALALAASASGLVLWLGLIGRKRMFAVAVAIGAKPRQLASFIWSEALFVSLGGVLFGATTGWGMTHMLVKVLQGVFDPAPSRFAVPWGYLTLVAGIMALTVLVATRRVQSVTRRTPIEMLRDL